MAFDNEYPNRKDWRGKYGDSRDIDHTCRAGGSCPWCRGNRLFAIRKMLEKAKQEVKEVTWEQN